MKKSLFLLEIFVITISLSSCSRQQNNDSSYHLSEENTTEEVKVYNDFIDKVYNVYTCHLEMDSPKEFLLYNENASKEEYEKHKAKFEQYLKSFNEMLDTLKITALVPDSLRELKIDTTNIYSKLDKNQKEYFNFLSSDTITLKSAYYVLDSLKSNRIYFEKLPKFIYKRIDWKNMTLDTINKYYNRRINFFESHYGKIIEDRYYIGVISLSRVKFNRDSTFCILECGYSAQNKCGFGNYYLLRKINGKWTIVLTIDSWVS